MKCPHCGMIIRENITECGYCGGKITPRPDRSAGGSSAPTGMVQGKAALTKGLPVESEGDEEEEGGLSRVLQPGEQVLIGALNVTVKKFFFHAYLTDQRIFLIDTQEKTIRVTAKDIPRNTIAGCIVEFSETSDPVLVLSLRSADDELKTMKLVFVQNGTDRSAEIDEWISLLQEDRPSRKAPRQPAPRQEEVTPELPEEAEPEIIAPEPPVVRRQQQELRPARKPTKDLEKQPPVKRLLSMYKVEEEPAASEPEEQHVPVPPPSRKAQIRQIPEPATQLREQEIPPSAEEREEPVRKPEVQSAMKVAMKSAMRPLQQPHTKPVRRTIAAEPMEEPVPAPVRRPVVHEPPKEKQVHEEDIAMATPQFCHNCGKKLPPAANFCPGCGTKLSQSRTLPQKGHPPAMTDRRARTDPPHEQPPSRPPVRYDDEDEDEGGETPVPAKPPVKKAPRGSEMTILHKFLRR